MLIEFSRNVVGVADADTAENEPPSQNIVIKPIACAVPVKDGPVKTGSEIVHPLPGTLLQALCGSELRGEYFCSFETNPEFWDRWRRS